MTTRGAVVPVVILRHAAGAGVAGGVDVVIMSMVLSLAVVSVIAVMPNALLLLLFFVGMRMLLLLLLWSFGAVVALLRLMVLLLIAYRVARVVRAVVTVAGIVKTRC